MMKKLVCLLVSVAMLCTLVPAAANAYYYDEDDGVIDVDSDDNAQIACGGTLTIDFYGGFPSSYYSDVEWYEAKVTDGSEYAQISASEEDYRIVAHGLSAGVATVTVSYSYDFYDDVPHDVESFQFTITAFELATTVSGTAYDSVDPTSSCWAYSNYGSDMGYATAKVKVPGLPADAYLECKDTHKYGSDTDVYSNGAGSMKFYVYGKGKHRITVYTTYGINISVTVTYKLVKLKPITTIKRTGSIVTKPKQKTALTLKANSKDVSANATWTSTNTKIATVSSKGVVKGKGKGHCYVKVKFGTVKMKLYVEVTSAKAYAAVDNAWEDYKTKIYYSQAKRNLKGYRDCSSFTRRCYYSNSPYRRVAVFGDTSWPLNAAGQASYLNSRGKCVAKKPVSISKVRPGDTVYYGGGSSNSGEYLGIYHADLYVGNGFCLGTSYWHNYAIDKGKTKQYNKYHIGYSNYTVGSPGVVFIGRLCS